MGSVGDMLTQEQLPCPLLEERFSALKQSIISPKNKQRVIDSYHRLTEALAVEADRIAKLGPAAVPEIEFADLEANGGVLPEGLEATVRQTGCLIVRGVVDEATASGWEDTLRAYTKSHPNVGGYPIHDPQNFSLFWTKPQVEMRSHANVLKANNAISKLWHVSDPAIPFDLSAQVAYADRFRIRHPSKVENYTLKAHQDSGAIERWEDPLYRACYQPIFDGAWEDYDAFNADFRSEAKTCLYSDKSCTAFRSFQGWISLSHTGTGEGTLRLLPELKMSTAYNLLRPYFILGEQYDDTTPVFPGATPGHIQFRPTPEMHPHLFLDKMTVGIPPVKPGDYVFWHCDLVHEVDSLHPGERDSSVSFNPCVPLCLYNLDSLVALRESFLAALPPRDFIKYDHGEYECKHTDHGAHKSNILTDEGLRAMGFLPFDVDEEGLSTGQKAIRKLANERLGFTTVAA